MHICMHACIIRVHCLQSCMHFSIWYMRLLIALITYYRYGSIGGFRVTGRMSTQCSLLDPISGELTVETSAVPICSIDIQLLRIESILLGEKIVTETSLIQTTQVCCISRPLEKLQLIWCNVFKFVFLYVYQIADGDVCRNLTLPIYVILPRLLTCPTIFAGWVANFSFFFLFFLTLLFCDCLKVKGKTTPTLY